MHACNVPQMIGKNQSIQKSEVKIILLKIKIAYYLFGLKLKTYLLCSGYRWGPLYCAVDEEVESSHLKFLATPPGNA
jgi:hypothetical protein